MDPLFRHTHQYWLSKYLFYLSGLPILTVLVSGQSMVYSDHVFGDLPLVQWRITIFGNWFSFVNIQLQMGKSELWTY
jgi:hypothetical protein